MRDLEVVILDDCSGDETEAVSRSLAAADPRVTYHCTDQPLIFGGKTLNRGISYAKGEHLAFLDDDDVWRPEKLGQQLAVLKRQPELGLVTIGVQHWEGETGKKLHEWIPNRSGNVYWESLGTSGEIFGPPSAVLIPRRVYDEVGAFREDMPRGPCQQYFRRIAKSHPIGFVPEVGVDYLVHRRSITSKATREDVLKHAVSLEVKIESIQEDLTKVPDVYADELSKLAKAWLAFGDRDKCRKTLHALRGLRRLSANEKLIWLTSMAGLTFSIMSSRYMDRQRNARSAPLG